MFMRSHRYKKPGEAFIHRPSCFVQPARSSSERCHRGNCMSPCRNTRRRTTINQRIARYQSPVSQHPQASCFSMHIDRLTGGIENRLQIHRSSGATIAHSVLIWWRQARTQSSVQRQAATRLACYVIPPTAESPVPQLSRPCGVSCG
jgi:hypothetical protein